MSTIRTAVVNATLAMEADEARAVHATFVNLSRDPQLAAKQFAVFADAIANANAAARTPKHDEIEPTAEMRRDARIAAGPIDQVPGNRRKRSRKGLPAAGTISVG